MKPAPPQSTLFPYTTLFRSNEPGNLIHVFATGQDTGEVFEKTSPISAISFGTGTGTIRLRDSSTLFRISNPTSDRKSTRLNSSHSQISYAVFCLKKKKHYPH